MNRRILSLALLAAILTAPAFAEDWSQWRGNNRDGVSTETGLLKQWPEGGPTLLWVCKDTGLAYSSSVVVGDILYTLGARGDTDYLVAISTNDGSPIWSTEIGPRFEDNFGQGARGTPTVDGDQVFALTASGYLTCVNASDGKATWTVRMQDFGGTVPRWGYSESVLVDGDKVLCTPGGPKGAVVALDRKTGALLWQTSELSSPAHYSSILPIEHGGKRQYVQILSGQFVGLDPDSGATLWSSPWGGRLAIPTPIEHNGQVYISSGYGYGCKLVKLDGSQPTDVYENKTMVNHHGGVVRIGEYLYGYSDGKGWVCQNFATGEMVWNNETLGKGAISAADDMLYLVSEKDGQVVLIEASHEGWKEHGRFTLPELSQKRGGGIWSHPVIANGKLYLRDQELLYCYDIAAK